MRIDPAVVQQQIASLRLQFPALADDAEAWGLSVESETDLPELMEQVVAAMLDAAGMAGAIATRIAELEARQGRYEQREKAMRALALKLMQMAGAKKLELPEATLSVRAPGRKLVISDDTAVPDDFCQITRAPDKSKIKALIGGGGAVNWAALVPTEESLVVRIK